MSAADVQIAVEAIRTVSAGRHLLLLTDFDGTLCAFNPDPAAVELPENRRTLLERLARQPATTIGIVSGRRLSDVRDRAGLRVPAYYAGLHGLEIEGLSETFRHPDVEHTSGLLAALAASLSGELASIDGAFVENKGLSIAAHFRNTTADDARRVIEMVTAASRPAVSSGDLRLMRGASVLELLPNIDWHKGSAVTWIRDRVARDNGNAWPLYVGDDVTDESAFRAVRGVGLSVSAASRASGADFSVDGPADVERLLELLGDG